MANSNESGGGLTFVISCVIFVVGYTVIAGHAPGVQGAFHWWSLIVLFLIMGVIDTITGKRAS